MAAITLIVLSDGTTLNSTYINDMFYQPVLSGVTNSLTMINGLLTADNIEPSMVITAEMTQKGSAVDVEGASGTANLDYRQNWFGGNVYSDNAKEFSREDQKLYVPGGCKTVHCKYTARALVMWTVFWQFSNSDNDANRSAFQLEVDGVVVSGQIRMSGQLGANRATPLSYNKSRRWCGHALVDLTQGWHDIGLVLQQSASYTTRVHAISIDVMSMKYGAAT